MSSSHRVLVTIPSPSLSAEANDCEERRYYNSTVVVVYIVDIVDYQREGEREKERRKGRNLLQCR